MRGLRPGNDLGAEERRSLRSVYRTLIIVGWRRSAIPPYDGSEADLGQIFRAHGRDGVDVLSFGLRFHPDSSSIYHLAKARL